MTGQLTGRKAYGWCALGAILLFNVICFGLGDSSYTRPAEVVQEPVQSKTSKRAPKFSKVTEIVLGR